jgi:hypothetical protein
MGVDGGGRPSARWDKAPSDRWRIATPGLRDAPAAFVVAVVVVAVAAAAVPAAVECFPSLSGTLRTLLPLAFAP